MAGSAARRARRQAAAGADVDDDPVIDEPEPTPRRRSDRTTALRRVVAAINQSGDDADDRSGPPSSLRMLGNEHTIAYAVAAVLALIPVIFIADNAAQRGSPSPVLPAIGLVLALAMVASVRLSNRIVTAILAVLSTLAATASAIPVSIRYLSTVDLLVALGFSVWLSLRQSKARNVATAERRRAQRAQRTSGAATTRPARGGRKGAKVEELKGPQPNRRYTPPKNRSST